jgi:hypothetical protein
MNPKLFFPPIITIIIASLPFWWYNRTADLGYIMLAILLINLGAAFWLVRSRRDWWSFAILPILLLASAFAYALIISLSWLALAIVSFAAIAAIAYWRLVFLYILKQNLYRPLSLERLSSFLSFFVIFFTAAAAYGLKVFLDLPNWQTVGVAFIFLSAIIYQWFWVRQLVWRTSWYYLLAFIVVMTEIFLVFGFLPFDFIVIGFLFASLWHGLSFLVAEHLSGQLTLKRSRFIISLIIILWVAILLTARWF